MRPRVPGAARLGRATCRRCRRRRVTYAAPLRAATLTGQCAACLVALATVGGAVTRERNESPPLPRELICWSTDPEINATMMRLAWCRHVVHDSNAWSREYLAACQLERAPNVRGAMRHES